MWTFQTLPMVKVKNIKGVFLVSFFRQGTLNGASPVPKPAMKMGTVLSWIRSTKIERGSDPIHSGKISGNGIRYFCIRWHMGRVGWVGSGWWRFFHLHTCDMLWTWRFLHLHTCDMLRKSWGGLGGWGRDDDVSFTCTHVTCYGLDISSTCTQVTCYASHGEGWVGGVGMMTFLSLAHMWHATRLTFLALAHMWHATQVTGRVGWLGSGWWRFYHFHTCDMLCTWRFLHLHTCDMLRKSWGGLGGWGGDDDVSFTCTHVALQQPKLVEAARTIVPTTLTKGKHACEWRFFFRCFLIKRRYPNTTTISQGICWWKGDTMMNNNTNTTFCVSQGKTVCLFFLSQIWSEGYTWLSCIPGWSELKVWPHQYIYRLYTGWVRCHKSWLPPHRFNRYLNCTRALKQLFVVPPTQCQKWVKPFLAD